MTNPPAREQLKDLVDTSAVESGIHMESVESGVIDILLDLIQLWVAVALIGDECGEGSAAHRRKP
jgi:hypothetical protein